MTDKVWKQKFSENLVAKMKEAGLNQRKLSDLANLGEPHISDLVNGKARPNAKTILKLRYALGCTTDELIDFGEEIEDDW